MTTATAAISDAKAEFTKLDRAAKEGHAAAEKFMREETEKFLAANSRLPMPGDEIFAQIDAGFREPRELRQKADNVRAAIEQQAAVASVGAYSYEDIAKGVAGELARTYSRRMADRVVKSERFHEMQTRLARGSGDSFQAISADLGVPGGRFALGPMLSMEEFIATVSGQPMTPQATTITGGSSTSAGPFVVPDYLPGFTPYMRKKPVMLNLVGVGETQSDTVDYTLQTSVSTAAAEVAENAVTAESAIAFSRTAASVVEMAHFVPVTRRALADAGQLRTIIEQDLLAGVIDRIDTQIASGNGSGQNLTGIYNASGILTFAVGASQVDALMHLMTLLAIQAGVYGEPEAIGMYPSDWESVRLKKDNDGNYLFGPPNIPGPKTAFGTTIVTSPVFTNGTPLGGLFSQYATAWMREAPQVFIGLDGNDFTYRRVSILAEARLAFATKRATGFCTITGF